MKQQLLKIILLSSSLLGLMSCNELKPTSGNSANSNVGNSQNTGNKDDPVSVTLTGAYASPAVLQYQNMRPSYNYYLTTFSFETIQLYSDNTYCLTLDSSCYSGLVLPDEGNDATGSARESYVTRYYGTCTQKTNELDEDTLDVSLATPTRIVRNFNSNYYVDTENYHSVTGKGAYMNDVTYETKEDFMKAFAFKPVNVSVSKTAASFDFFQTEALDEGTSISTSAVGYSITGSYMSSASLGYMNVRPTYNYYVTTMNQQVLDLLDSTHYCFSIYSTSFSGLVLPIEGNGAQGNERANYVLSFYGTYTKTANELDDSMSDISLSAPSRVTFNYDGAYYVDSDNWDDAAKTHTQITDTTTQEVKQYASGSEYLNSFNTKATSIAVTEETANFDFVDYTAQLY